MDNYNFKKTPCVLHSTRKGYPKRCLAKAVCSDAYDIFDRYNMGETNGGRCQKKPSFFLGLCPKLWVGEGPKSQTC